jgi:cold shock CspA family protein
MTQVISKLIETDLRDLDVQCAKPGDRPVVEPGRHRAALAAKRLRPLGPRLAGEIIRIKEGMGFGFIRPDGGLPEHYVHVSALVDRSLWKEGQRVTFVPGPPSGGRKAPPALAVEAEEAP